MRTKIVVVLAILILCISGAGMVSASTNSSSDFPDPGANKTLTSVKGVEYTTYLNTSSRTLSISAYNPNQESVSAWLAILLNRTPVWNSEFNLSAGEHRSLSYNITPYIRSGTSPHNLQIYTTGNETGYSFSLNVSSESPHGVPLPEIDNVELAETTIHGEPTSVLRVTVKNDARIPYTPKIYVTTIQTHSEVGLVTFQPNESRKTLVVPLNEEPGMVVAGEVRLFSGQIRNGPRISDQIEFEGHVDGETDVWDREFEPIRIDYTHDNVDAYHYHNASIERKNDDIWRERLKPVAVLAGAMLVAILLAVALLSRRR